MSLIKAQPTLFVIAGPNGAGKTTFYETVLKPRLFAPFINADFIQRDELKDASAQAAYKAAQIASDQRKALLRAKKSFVTETVFSHESKLQLLLDARKAGYRIVVFHLHLGTADLAVARVAERRKEGGHDVPETKIRERYVRNQKLIRQAVLFADSAAVYDASPLNHAPILLLKIASGVIEFEAASVPRWFKELYGDVRKGSR